MNVSRRRTSQWTPGPIRTVSIAGTGSCLPHRVLSNADLEKMVDTTDDWITSRTGIRERRIAGSGELTSDMGAEAARRALADAKIAAARLDVIICATITPDMPFPSTACVIQAKIGASRAMCFDVEAACSGFIYALEVGKQFVMTSSYEHVLVVAAEKLSSIIDWKDRNTCVLFGDGAGAVLLQHTAGSQGIMTSSIGSDGTRGELLCMPGGGCRHPASVESVQGRLHYLKMSGKEVFKQAIVSMQRAAEEALHRCQLRVEDLACVIPHQANMRIIQGLAERMKVHTDKFYINMHRYGNMSAASAAVALDEGAREGRFQRGDHILLIAFGAGLTWGATVIQW